MVETATVNETPAVVQTDQPHEVAEERIRLRAYELFLERSGAAGDAVSDWVRAESEIREAKSEAPKS